MATDCRTTHPVGEFDALGGSRASPTQARHAMCHGTHAMGIFDRVGPTSAGLTHALGSGARTAAPAGAPRRQSSRLTSTHTRPTICAWIPRTSSRTPMPWHANDARPSVAMGCRCRGAPRKPCCRTPSRDVAGRPTCDSRDCGHPPRTTQPSTTRTPEQRHGPPERARFVLASPCRRLSWRCSAWSTPLLERTVRSAIPCS